MKLSSAVGGGFIGATVLTLLHETIKRVTDDAPRMDKLGMEAIGKSLNAVDAPVPAEDDLFKITLAGDVISNGLYYSLTGLANEQLAIPVGAAIGLAAGLGAVYLPKPLGLTSAYSNRTAGTKLMAVGLYLVGGLVSGAAAKLIEASNK